MAILLCVFDLVSNSNSITKTHVIKWSLFFSSLFSITHNDEDFTHFSINKNSMNGTNKRKLHSNHMQTPVVFFIYNFVWVCECMCVHVCFVSQFQTIHLVCVCVLTKKENPIFFTLFFLTKHKLSFLLLFRVCFFFWFFRRRRLVSSCFISRFWSSHHRIREKNKQNRKWIHFFLCVCRNARNTTTHHHIFFL